MTGLARQRGLGLIELMVLLILLSLAATAWWLGRDTEHTDLRAMITVKSTQLVAQYAYLYGIAQGALPTLTQDCADSYSVLADALGAEAWRAEAPLNGWQQPITLSCAPGSRVVTLRQTIPQPELVGFLLEHLPYSEASLDADSGAAILETDIELAFPDSLNLMRSVSLDPHDDYAEAELDTRGFCRSGEISYSVRLPSLCSAPSYDGESVFWLRHWQVEDRTTNPRRKIIFRVSAAIQQGIAIEQATPARDQIHTVAADAYCRPAGADPIPSELSILAFCDHKVQ